MIVLQEIIENEDGKPVTRQRVQVNITFEKAIALLHRTKEGRNDETYTEVERVYATRIDCCTMAA